MKDITKDTSEKLAKARKSKGYTQADIAQLSGLQVSNISRIEHGAQNLSLKMIQRYCEVLNRTPEFVLHDDAAEYDPGTEYILKIFDTDLIKFTMQRTGHADIKVHITWINRKCMHLMPVSLVSTRQSLTIPASGSESLDTPGNNELIEITDDALKRWLRQRHIPAGRAYVHELLESVGLDLRDTKGIIDISKALSLNDSYWVMPRTQKQYFDDVNLYDNKFSEQLGRIAFVGMSQPAQHNTSPEFTTGGMLRKAWRRPVDRQGLWLYKGGTEGDSGNEGNETYSEYYACQIARAMGLNAVAYDLEMFKGILSSVCPLFTSRDISFVHAGAIPGCYELEDIIDFYKELGPRFYDELCDMLVFDALVFNKDRHFSNFGLLRDNSNGAFIAPAPIFDNGAALFPMASRYDFGNLDEYSKKQNPPYERTWEEVLAIALSSRQKTELKKILKFKFTEHPHYNLPEWRLHALEDFLHKRVAQILQTDV